MPSLRSAFDLHGPTVRSRFRGGRPLARYYLGNVTNKRGLIGGGYYDQTNYASNWFNYIQPRTVGVTVDRSF